jgi:hypothetical protein
MPSLLVSTPKRRSTSSAREPRARTFCEFGMTRPIIRLSRQDASCTKGGNEAGVQAFTGTPDYGHVPRNGPLQIGAPDWIRTSDLQLRRLPLYPSELRAH